MTQLYAQPYDISATGFYFSDMEDYTTKYAKCKNNFGGQVEEFEIQFIDGEDLDCDLFNALSVYQGDIKAFFTICGDWEDYQKIDVIIAVSECGYDFDLKNDDPDRFDIDLYELDSLRDLAYQLVDEGLFGDIPDNIQCYLDFDAIARDLGMDYTETRLNGINYIYRIA